MAAAMLLTAAVFVIKAPDREVFLTGWENGEFRLSAYGNRADRGELRLKLERGGVQIASLTLPLDRTELESLPVHWMYDAVQVIAGGKEEKTYMLHYDGVTALCGERSRENICAVRAENGSCLFSVDAMEYIENFNLQRALYGCDPLPAPDEEVWRAAKGFNSPLSGRRLLRFSYKDDFNNGLEPEMALYTDEESGALEMAAIGFENHGYTQWGTLLSKERAFFALKAFLPEEKDGRLWGIYEAIYQPVRMAENYTAYGETPKIARLFVYEQLGLFTYFSGGTSWLCLIPSDEMLIQQLSGSGTELMWL